MGSIAQALIEEGFEKGIQKGKIEGKAEIIKIMLRNGTDIRIISKQLGVPVKEIEKMII